MRGGYPTSEGSRTEQQLTTVQQAQVQLVSQVGSGGMGGVWLARRNDGLHEGIAAIKLLHAGTRSALTEARFAAEGRMLGRLEHPHVATFMRVSVNV